MGPALLAARGQLSPGGSDLVRGCMAACAVADSTAAQPVSMRLDGKAEAGLGPPIPQGTGC